MTPEDVAELSSDAVLIVRDGLIAHANRAAVALFASCGQGGDLVGRSLGALGESDALHIVASTPQGTGGSGEFAVRVARADAQSGGEYERLQRLQAAINEADDAISIVDPRRLEYLEVNEAAARMRGLAREEMRALGPVGMLLRASGRDEAIGVPEAEAPIRQMLKARYDDLIARHPEAVTEERTIRAVDGSERRVESVRRAFQSSGRWLVILVNRDISTRYSEQQRLQRLQAAMNQAADAIFVTDPETLQYLDANEAGGRLLGLSRQQILVEGPLGVARRFSGRSREQVQALYRELIAAHPQAAIELQVQRVGQGRRVVEWTRRAVQVENRWLIISIARDVTERERAQEELRQRMDDLARSNRDLEQFAYVTSHDLSEPLRMIASYTQLLERRYSKLFDDDAREFMGYVTGGAQRMRQLIDDLLMYSRAGRREVRALPVPLDQPLDEALANLAKAIADSGATIERPHALPTLPCDRSSMMQLFQNLVGNALKFRGAEPLAVRIDAQQDEGGWTISVRDNGIGIEPKYFERIFVIFQRLHARTEYEGTGIGLAICKRIVEQHGGRISVESQPGSGSAFRFFLPSR